ncbi:MAG: hypothetical protein ABW321_35015 [Polyangiales bacterium]
MTLRLVLLSLHVVIAILGLGQLGAIAFAARAARHASDAVPGLASNLARSLRTTQISSIAMLSTGVLLEVVAATGYHRGLWFRASGVLLLLALFSQTRARAALRRLSEAATRSQALADVERWCLTACGLVATIAVLMEVKAPW